MAGARELEEERSPVIFTNLVITDCIFNHLQYADILSCAAVSKTLNTLARDFLRLRRTNLLKCTIDALDSLQQAIDLLSSDEFTFRQLFTGVHVSIDAADYGRFVYEHEERSPHAPWISETRTQLEKIFELVPMKHLIVELTGCPSPYRHCFVSSTHYLLDFVFSSLPENELDTLKISGLVYLFGYKGFPWRRLNSKKSSNLKTLHMGGKDHELPPKIETTDPWEDRGSESFREWSSLRRITLEKCDRLEEEHWFMRSPQFAEMASTQGASIDILLSQNYRNLCPGC